MRTILMYNCDHSKLFEGKDINCVVVDKNNQHETLGYLLKYFGFMANKKKENTSFDETMIVFDGFDDDQLDEALAIIKGHAVTLKAITTCSNIGWSAYKLFGELMEEKKFIESQKR